VNAAQSAEVITAADEVKRLLSGKGPVIIGFALAHVMASWVASQSSEEDGEELLETHVNHIRDLANFYAKVAKTAKAKRGQDLEEEHFDPGEFFDGEPKV
jgi:hypothetical protein